MARLLFWVRLMALCALSLLGLLGVLATGYVLHAAIPLMLILTAGP